MLFGHACSGGAAEAVRFYDIPWIQAAAQIRILIQTKFMCEKTYYFASLVLISFGSLLALLNFMWTLRQ